MSILLFILFISLFFLLHIFFQRLISKNLIYNFVYASIISNILFLYSAFYFKLNDIYLWIILMNIFISQLIYLIIIQSLRSSIQIYILKNYKKINLSKIKNENLKIYNSRINNLHNNNLIRIKKNRLINNINFSLNLTYYIFLFLKKIYDQKF